MRIGMGCKAQTTDIAVAMARICNAADRPRPRLHTREEIVNTFLQHAHNHLRLAFAFGLVTSHIGSAQNAGPVMQPRIPRHHPNADADPVLFALPLGLPIVCLLAQLLTNHLRMGLLHGGQNSGKFIAPQVDSTANG